MQVTRKSRLLMRVQRVLFVLLVLGIAGLIAWLSTRYTLTADWTANGRHSLSAASIATLERMDGPLSITAYAREDPILRQHITNLVKRYQGHKDDLELRFVNPDAVPDQLRELGITIDGELIISYAGRSEHLVDRTEQGLTNALQRIARAGERWLVFLVGHGERSSEGMANHDLHEWVRQLESRGVRTRSINLAETGAIPDNASALVIADPQVDLLPGEVQIVLDYVESGGNLLWLLEPGSIRKLGPLAELTGIGQLPGTVIDPIAAQRLSIPDPSMVVITSFGRHATTIGLLNSVLLPRPRPLAVLHAEGWQTHILFETSAQAWSETGQLTGAVAYDEATDILGPLAIGAAITRVLENGGTEGSEQRIIVIGDADFLSNAYLGNIGNLDMGIRLINWLIKDDTFINIPVRTAPDQVLELSRNAILAIGLGFLFGLPLTLLITGFVIWWQRRRA